MRPARLVFAAALTAAAGAVTPAIAATHAADSDFFPGCAAYSSNPVLALGSVNCLELPSPAIDGTTAFSYYVPPDCAPALGRHCPVFYLLHGFGGDYTSMLGTHDHPSAYVAALASGPTTDPHEVSDPWSYSDPAQWVAKPPIDAVMIAPDGRTVPGGYGPSSGLDGYWIDWNPRYAGTGQHPRYDTPPPKFEKQFLDELIPYVESAFPVGRGPSWRALVGESLGGYGSYTLGLRHPDTFASVSSVSGAMNFLFAPGIDPGAVPAPVGVSPPVQPPVRYLPAAQAVAPFSAIPSSAQGFGVALLALGDPAADQAYFRGHMPRDLAANARAFNAHGLAVDLRAFSNDAVPHNPTDLTDPAHFVGAQAFESIVLPMNTDQRLAFRDVGVNWNYELHPGTHSGEYWNAWFRDLYEKQYAVVRHWDGTGAPLASPARFDYRSTDTYFAVWGWQFHVARPTTEFVNLTNVTCRALTLRGTGSVTVTVPTGCRTGVDGHSTFAVDLGPSYPTGETGGVGALSAYGQTKTVQLGAL
ncbi:MAG: alpha/beta hydrolase [Actinomycetes bacterium]